MTREERRALIDALMEEREYTTAQQQWLEDLSDQQLEQYVVARQNPQLLQAVNLQPPGESWSGPSIGAAVLAGGLAALPRIAATGASAARGAAQALGGPATGTGLATRIGAGARALLGRTLGTRSGRLATGGAVAGGAIAAGARPGLPERATGPAEHGPEHPAQRPRVPRAGSARAMGPGGFAEEEEGWLWPQGMAIPPELQEDPTGLRWTEGDANGLFSMPREDLIRMQRELERVGLLQRPYRIGHVDQSTMEAYREALGWGNFFGGWNVNRTIGELSRMEIAEPEEEAGGAGADFQFEPFQRQEFVPPTYRNPDPAEVANSLKSAWRQRLGREITDGELQQFQAAFGGFHREAFETEVGLQQQQFEHQQSTAEMEHWNQQARMSGMASGGGDFLERQGEMRSRPPRPEVAPPPPEEVPDVDPDARIAAAVDEHFQPEVERLQRRDESADLFGLMQRGLAIGDRVMGA